MWVMGVGVGVEGSCIMCSYCKLDSSTSRRDWGGGGGCLSDVVGDILASLI